MTLRIAALASGRGSNVAALVGAIEAGRLDAEMVLVASNNPAAPVLDFARAKHIPVWAKSHKDAATREAFDRYVLDALKESQADTIVLAGYMRIISPFLIQEYAGRILNIHPAVLPSFAGAHGGKDAVEYGVRISGVTVHFVDEIMDNGPVIIQGVVPLTCNDSESDLMPRIHALEHVIFAQALQWLAEDRLRITGRRVVLLPKPEKNCNRQNTSDTVTMHHAFASCGVHPEYGPWMVSPPLEM